MKERLSRLIRGPQIWVIAALAAVAPVIVARWFYLATTDMPDQLLLDPVFLACGGVVGLTGMFVALLAAARALLGYGGGLFGVARTVLDEAIRMKVAIVFIVLLLIVVPSLPFLASTADALRYQVQSFLSYSMTATLWLLSLLTIFLACWTLSGEIEQKQIFTIATKPISRAKYLLGKWVGIVVLNGILLAVASTGIWGYTTLYLANQTPADSYDAQALEQEVLTARLATVARPTYSVEERAEQRLREMYQRNPQAIRSAGERMTREMNLLNPSEEQIIDYGLRSVMGDMLQEEQRQWRSIRPHGQAEFVFEGLDRVRPTRLFSLRQDVSGSAEALQDGRLSNTLREAFASHTDAGSDVTIRPSDSDEWEVFAGGTRYLVRRESDRLNVYRSEAMQFRYSARVTEVVPEGQLPVIVEINGRNRFALDVVVGGQPQVVPMPVDWIRDGQVHIRIYNRDPSNPDAERRVSLVFDGGDGLMMMYQAGSFTPNFIRAMLQNWLKLAFLAMLGLAAATCLGFPVASLLSVLLFFAAVASPFVMESAQMYGGDILREGMADTGALLARILSTFAYYNGTPLIVEGRLISWSDVAGCLAWIGILWTGLAAVVGIVIFRTRELARVQV